MSSVPRHVDEPGADALHAKEFPAPIGPIDRYTIRSCDPPIMKRALSRRTFVGTIGVLFTLAGCLNSSESAGEESPDSSGDGSSDASEPTEEDSAEEEPAEEESEGSDASEPEDVTFESTAGTTVEGTIYGEGGCGVVLTPQINLDRESWTEQARQLADDGYLALAIDEDEDNRPESVLGAVDYLMGERETERIVLIGASSGGEASVVANARAETDAVTGIVAISPGGGTERASDLQGRKLFVVAEDDDERFVRTTEELHEQASDPKELRIYSGSEHGQDLFETEHGEDLLEGIVTLVEEACGEG